MTKPIPLVSARGAAVLTLLLLLACMPAAAASGSAPQPLDPAPSVEAPRLVVVLVVDQLRGDLLGRYAELFQGGFHRLLTEGRVFTRALHDHAATETAPGHAAISTSTHPARAGIPANAWREGEGTSGHTVFNVIDPTTRLVGSRGLPGASPRVLRRPGLADWVREADPEARVVSVSAKARAAVLMAGQSQGDVFWFDPAVGRFVTSSFYTDRNPDWLDAFNAEVVEGYRKDTVWVSTIPGGRAGLSAPDTSRAEGDGEHTAFPHRYLEERGDSGSDDFFLWFEQTPMLDAATLQLARVAIEARGVGRRSGGTDFLSVSLSQTDRVGHAYGPLSREQMDNLLRLDRELAVFLAFLDESVGRGSYVVGVTADHGTMTMPEREGAVGRRLSRDDRAEFQAAMQRAGEKSRISEQPLSSLLADEVRPLPMVGPVYTQEALKSGEAGDSLAALFRHSFVPGRWGGLLSPYGVEMWWAENTLTWGYPRGSTHGSPWFYDRWVPLILLGPGIEPGEIADPVSPMDLAPTLATLAGIPFPDDLDGEPLPVGR